jgi:hypothetical protein
MMAAPLEVKFHSMPSKKYNCDWILFLFKGLKTKFSTSLMIHFHLGFSYYIAINKFKTQHRSGNKGYYLYRNKIS